MPRSITKNKRDHVVPLNKLAVDVLEEIKPLTGEFLYPFAGGVGNGFKEDTPMLSNSLNRAISRYSAALKEQHLKNLPDKAVEAIKAPERFIARDIRRTVKTHMAKAGISKSIRDRLQNHALTDISSKHYDRYDYLEEKKEALKIWEDYLSKLVDPVKNTSHVEQVLN